MDRSRRAIERQRTLVETLSRQLHFELLVLRRLTAVPENTATAASDFRDVFDRAVLRQSESLLQAADNEMG